MAFTRDDLKSYESQTPAQVPDTRETLFAIPEAKSPEAAPQAKNEEAEVDAAIAASVNAEPAEPGNNDGSTTEQEAEPVAAESANPEGENTPESEESTNDGKPRGRAQERIEELVAERNALRKYGEYLLSQVDELRKGSVAKQQESQPAATQKVDNDDDPPPTLESAEYDPDKLSKLQSEWIQRQVNKRVESAVQQIESRQSEVATRQAFEAKAAEFRKTAPDFDLVISNPSLPSLSQEAAKVVVRSDNGPAIAYHLAKNPDLAIRISRMEPVSQAAAIGRLEEQLVRAKTETVNTSKEPSKTTKPAAKPAVAKVTQAPPPPKPVQGSAPPSKDEHVMSMDEWVANERAKKIKEREARLSLRRAMR
jgi:hypothetical protein